MSRLRHLPGLLVVVLVVTLGATSAYAENRGRSETLYEKVVDLVLVRPLGLVPIVVAPVGCLLGLPVALVMKSPVEPLELCLEDPVAHTFRRPLGDL